MEAISYTQFREKLAMVLDTVNRDSKPVKITRKNGANAVVMSLDDWEREQETLYVLQNQPLMQQIARSLHTHQQQQGKTASQDTLNEILGI